jgi:hypothetical protein
MLKNIKILLVLSIFKSTIFLKNFLDSFHFLFTFTFILILFKITFKFNELIKQIRWHINDYHSAKREY